MTIGTIIKELEEILDKEENPMMKGVSREFDSYRGYYKHLAMASSSGREMSLVSFLNVLYRQLGKTFEGYKGGEFLMDTSKELFVAEYGRLGYWVVGVEKIDDFYQLKVSDKDFNGY